MGPEQSAEIVINPAAENQQTVEPTLYDTREAQHIVDILRSSVYRPEAVILFGSLAGGTPHSDIAAYDLLIITDEIHLTGEQAARRYLKLKMPPKHRGIGYINPYIYTKKFIASHTHSPVFYLAKTEGTVLYCHKRYRIPTQTCCDFGAARNDALYYFSHIYGLGNQLLEMRVRLPSPVISAGPRSCAHKPPCCISERSSSYFTTSKPTVRILRSFTSASEHSRRI